MDMQMLDVVKHVLENEYGKIAVWLLFILALMGVDLLTGFVQAWVNKNILSGKMSTGILKKFSLFVVLVVIIPLTFLLPQMISVSVIIAVYILETLNEMISITENLKKMGIDVKIFKPIMDRLKVDEKDERK